MVTAVPFIVIILIQTYGLIKWLIEDYSKIPSHLIEQKIFEEYQADNDESKHSNQQVDIDIVSPAALKTEHIKGEVL